MTEQKKPKKLDPKKIIILAVILAVVCVGIIFAGQYIVKLYDGYTTEEQQEISDEIKRTKDFIGDWYDELSLEYGTCDVYLNELQFLSRSYTLTYAGKRLRAVYPVKGVRNFKLDYINNVEFFQTGGKIRCRLYYGNEDFTFALND